MWTFCAKGCGHKQRTPKIGERWGFLPLKPGRATSMGVRINRKEPANWGMLGLRPLQWGVADPLEIRCSHKCYSTEFGRSRSNGTNFIKKIRMKNMTPRVSPFKVTQGHRNRHESIHHRSFHINHGPISYRFRYKREFRSTIANFSHPRVFNAPAEGVSLGIL